MGQDDSDGESNDGADGHKNNDDDDDGGCLNSVKNRFRNKQVDLENLSLPISARWRKYCSKSFYLISYRYWHICHPDPWIAEKSISCLLVTCQ